MNTFKSPAIHRTPLYRAKSAFIGMTKRALNRNGKSPTYANVELRITEEEWLTWALPKYEECIREYPEESPNVARFGDMGHYEIGNIDIVPYSKNRAEQTARSNSLAKPDGSKKCSSCKAMLTIGDFYASKRMLDGLQKNCKICCRKMQTGGVLKEPRKIVEIAHGTRNGYQLEMRRGIVPCQACKDAHREWMRLYRSKVLDYFYGPLV